MGGEKDVGAVARMLIGAAGAGFSDCLKKFRRPSQAFRTRFGMGRPDVALQDFYRARFIRVAICSW